ncbi:MAG: PAS domain S-box protein [Candidatus Marinimicrobia bacterium]|nr:PAS domain S-box protein [Candidatus Neomarinimicrobiota bacterium]
MLRTFVENSSTGIYVVNDKYQFEYVNDRACDLVGYSKDELIGSAFVDFLGPSKDLVVNRYKKRQSGLDIPSDYEIDIRTKSGEVRYFHLYASAFTDSEGNTKSIGHILDITELKTTTAELNRLHQAMQQSPSGVMIMDNEANIEYVNSAFLRSTGYTEAELLGKHSGMLQSDLQEAAVYQEITKTILSGKTWTGELCNRKKSGEIYWVRSAISPIFNEEQQISHYISLEEDITALKQEMRVLARNQQLRDLQYEILNTALRAQEISELYEQVYNQLGKIIQSDNFLMAILDEAKERIYFPFDRDTSDESMPISIAYDSQTSLTGRTIAEGKTLHLRAEEIIKLSQRNELRLVGKLPSVWLGVPLMVEDEVIGAFVIQEYDGITKYAEEDVKAMELSAGQVALAIDRTRKRDALEKLAEELRNTNDIKELLLDVITHDLRSPAGVIKTLSEVLVTEKEEDDLMKTIKQSSESLLMVIENASVLSKINVGEAISRKPIVLHELIEDVIAEFAPQLKSARMQVKSHLDESIKVEANLIIAEIPKNYINNAIKYASRGREIEVWLRKEADRVTLRVEDHGTPVPEENRQEIFNRFTRIDATDKQGRGLGLAIVKRIADAHDAEVGVEVSPNGGNSFYLRF